MIQHNHEQHHVGYYPTAEEAARAYDRKALLFMGPSAITNFPATDYNGINLEAEGSVEDQVGLPALVQQSDADVWAHLCAYLSALQHRQGTVSQSTHAAIRRGRIKSGSFFLRRAGAILPA